MTEEYWTIINRFHRNRDHQGIRLATKLQLELMLENCHGPLYKAVNLFLMKNFSGPQTNTG